MARAMALYTLACVVIIGLAAGVFIAIYGAAGDRRAVMVSAVLALVVQVVAFAIARMMSESGNGIAGWALGAVISFATLVIYGFVSRTLGLPPTVALLSLATFFFLTELIEPPLLTV